MSEAAPAAGEEIVLRPFAPGDQAALRRLVLDGLGDHWGTIDETLNPDLDDILGWYGPRGGRVVVAERGGWLVGGGILYRDDVGTGRLARMTVAKGLRGQGLGRRLVAYLVEVARRRGDDAVVCETTDTWQDAIGLYLRCGFREVDRRDGDIHFRLDLVPNLAPEPALDRPR